MKDISPKAFERSGWEKNSCKEISLFYFHLVDFRIWAYLDNLRHFLPKTYLALTIVHLVFFKTFIASTIVHSAFFLYHVSSLYFHCRTAVQCTGITILVCTKEAFYVPNYLAPIYILSVISALKGSTLCLYLHYARTTAGLLIDL